MGDMPITLIVKAPNQRIADQNVECTLGWTIRKLKEHLQHVYPNKPQHNQQKLIYSGKLLEDNLTLKQVLRQDDDNIHHTVHLVCSALHDTIIEDTQNVDKSSPSPSPRSVPSSTNSTSSTDGLPMPPMYSAMPAGYSQEQYNMMMQQMYSQYMNQYMQYTMGVTPPPSPATPVVPEEAVNRNNGGNDRPANQNIRMNAQGGVVEDDDENEQRDWLDCIYMLFRVMVLFSIVYFYSTVTRSIAVFLAFLLIYENRTATDENTETNTTETPVQPPAPTAPSVIATAWCFFSTFFSSLIPEQPAAVNQN
ncbi:hypothetical protein LOTGIDRAFT_124564 [Lottia gigantea]|uniref:Ubiquitin-like domain-containing protein n=1 Tax=Lottia gigantea TaxID=225164 RepID=V4BLU4_LOTGI|nr:hypothetical protein LOTGIDRAFT_124564 [Lottia gigantea]ESO89779.1 hypothetical protein LOTGIDRAFT_124564 [Lottia gigantea]